VACVRAAPVRQATDPATHTIVNDTTEKMLTISVVIAVYNQRSYIEDAIRSVQGQDWPVQEIIVVDDGSTDADYRELETLYDRVRVIRTENRGVSRARNLGAARTNSSVVTFIDADDVWLPGKLSRQMNYLEQNESVDAVFCESVFWFPTRGDDGCETWHAANASKSHQNKPYRIRRLRYIELLCHEHHGHIGTLLIRKAAFTALGGFDERRRYGEDHELYIRASQSFRIDILEYPGMLYRQHAESATHKLPKANHLAEVMVEAIERYGLESGDSVVVNKRAVQRRLAYLHFGHGRLHFLFGSHAVAINEFWRSCKYRFDLLTVIYLITAVTPGGRSLARCLRKLFKR